MSKYSAQQELDKNWPSFDYMWRDSLSMFPEVPIDWKDREKWKAFAERVYNHILDIRSMQDVVQIAYEEGFQDCQDNHKNED